MKLLIKSQAQYELPSETFLTMMVEPPLKGEAHQICEEALFTSSTIFSELWFDAFHNPIRRFVAPEGLFGFTFTAIAEVQPNEPVPDDAIQLVPSALPPETLLYTLPSRYCQSDELTRMALSEFGDLPPGGGRVNAIAQWINKRVEYRYSTTDAMTSAYDTATQRIGVCRDFAHLLISFCRALGVPARYVSGYCLELEPPDFHAYVQVYLSGQWYNVDATCADIRPAVVPIAIGRDAADVAMATIWGTADLQFQSVEVSRVEEE